MKSSEECRSFGAQKSVLVGPFCPTKEMCCGRGESRSVTAKKVLLGKTERNVCMVDMIKDGAVSVRLPKKFPMKMPSGESLLRTSWKNSSVRRCGGTKKPDAYASP